MTALPASSSSWPRLAGLTLLVLAAHGLVLLAAPLRLAASKPEAGDTAKTFVTRSIAPPPVAQAPEPVVPPPQPKPKPAPRPKIVPNQAVAPIARARVAIDLVAPDVASNLPEVALASPPAENAPPEASLPPAATPQAAVTASQPAAQTPTAVVSVAPSVAASVPANGVPPAAQPTVVSDISLPASARLIYAMTGTSKGLTYHADAELAWRNSGSNYEAGMKVSAFLLGSRSMSSVGRVTPGGLAPTRFSDKSRSEVAAHFEADKGKVSFSANTPDAPLLEGAQDRVSVFFQLGGILAATAGKQSPLVPGSTITIYTVGPREADTWTFTVEAEEQLSLPAGDMATLKLTRKPRREFDQKVEIWYAPALAYLPVRNRITQANGDFVDQQMKSLERP